MKRPNTTLIRATDLRRDLARVLDRARRGERFTVLYRSRPVCEIIPLGAAPSVLPALKDEPLYRGGAVGNSRASRREAAHDEVLYGWRRR